MGGIGWLVALVVVLALIATLSDGMLRGGRRRHGATGQHGEFDPGRAVSRGHVDASGEVPVPRAGEVWWGELPGAAEPLRPCLVVSVSRGVAVVAAVTEGRRGERPGTLEIPGSVLAAPEGGGLVWLLETGELAEVPVGALGRRAGALPEQTWVRVSELLE